MDNKMVLLLKWVLLAMLIINLVEGEEEPESMHYAAREAGTEVAENENDVKELTKEKASGALNYASEKLEGVANTASDMFNNIRGRMSLSFAKKDRKKYPEKGKYIAYENIDDKASHDMDQYNTNMGGAKKGAWIGASEVQSKSSDIAKNKIDDEKNGASEVTRHASNIANGAKEGAEGSTSEAQKSVEDKETSAKNTPEIIDTDGRKEATGDDEPKVKIEL